MGSKTILVTVGTTSFDELIECVLSLEFLDLLIQMEFENLLVQYGGTSALKQSFDKGIYRKRIQLYSNQLCITPFSLKPSLQADISNADVIIGHAGAGTALEALRAHKRLIMVVNEHLMNNHQSELAKKLQELNCILIASPSTLMESLKGIKDWVPSPLSPPRMDLFNSFLKRLTGVSVLS